MLIFLLDNIESFNAKLVLCLLQPLQVCVVLTAKSRVDISKNETWLVGLLWGIRVKVLVLEG